MICFSFGMFWLCSSMRNRWCQAYRAQLHGRDPEARFFRNLEIQDSPNLDHLVWEWKLLILLRFSSLMLVDIDPASAHGSKDPNGSKFGFRCRISGRKNFRSKFWGRWEAPIGWRDCVKPLLFPRWDDLMQLANIRSLACRQWEEWRTHGRNMTPERWQKNISLGMHCSIL